MVIPSFDWAWFRLTARSKHVMPTHVMLVATHLSLHVARLRQSTDGDLFSPGPPRTIAAMPEGASVVELFLGSVDDGQRDAYESVRELDSELRSAWENGRQSWPGVDLSIDDFVIAVAERCVADGDRPELPRHASDLYLATACLAGDRAAVRHFESEVLGKLATTLKRFRLSPSQADEIRQTIFVRLLVGSETRPPALSSYLGTGALVHWVRAVAARETLSSFRGAVQTTEVEDELLADPSDPLLTQLKERYREEFKHALHAAVAELSSKDRMALRALVVDGRSVAELAAVYNVHRVTASRWISRIRKAIFRRTRAFLRAQQKLTNAEIDSMIRLIESQMEMSLVRVLEQDGTS